MSITALIDEAAEVRQQLPSTDNTELLMVMQLLLLKKIADDLSFIREQGDIG